MYQDRISAGGNLTIETGKSGGAGGSPWRLYINSGGAERLLVEVEAGQPIRYAPIFATQRRMPAGSITAAQVQRVVVGWSNRDESWHLGMMLAPELAQQRGSRWCELAHWPDSDTTLYGDIATQAGESLAAHLDRPFNFVPPRPDDLAANAESSESERFSAAPPRTAAYGEAAYRSATPAPAYPVAEARPAPPPPLPALPLQFERWTLSQRSPSELTLKLSPSWGRARLLRALWYMLWAGVFVILAVTSLNSGIALPRMGTINLPNGISFTPPQETLVYAGFVCAVILVLAAFANLISAARVVKRIEIDGSMREVRGMRGKRIVWGIPAADLEAVYASHVVSSVKPNSSKPRTVHYGELLLLVRDAGFKHLLSQHNFDDKISPQPPLDGVDPNEEVIVPLTQHTAQTEIHAAALYIARTLNIPARYDQRVR